MRWLAYLHPALMLTVLALALVVLREGLGVRRSRLARCPPYDSSRHRRLARIVVALATAGYAGGLASMLWLRRGSVADSAHFPIASAALALLLAAGVLGLALERRAGMRARTAHALCGGLGVLLALVAGAAGMAILP